MTKDISIVDEEKGVEKRKQEVQYIPCPPNLYPYEQAPEFEQIHIIDYVNILMKRRWLIIAGVFFVVLFAGIKSKTTPPTFTASAKFIPSKSPDVVTRMGTLVDMGGQIQTEGSQAETSEYYIELLKSSTFIVSLSKRKFQSRDFGAEVDLFDYLKITAADEPLRSSRLIKIISTNMKVSVSRTSKVLTLSYSTSDPELSASIVNGILEELISYNQNTRNTKSKQNREFIQKQLDDNQERLKKTEAAYAEFLMRNRKIVTPELQLEHGILKRNVNVQEEVYITLRKQLELAMIEEQEQRPSIEIVEKARVPLTKSAPNTRKNVMLAGFVSIVLFVGLAFVLEYASKMMSAEEKRNQEFLGYLGDIKNDFFKVFRFFGIIRRKKRGT